MWFFDKPMSHSRLAQITQSVLLTLASLHVIMATCIGAKCFFACCCHTSFDAASFPLSLNAFMPSLNLHCCTKLSCSLASLLSTCIGNISNVSASSTPDSTPKFSSKPCELICFQFFVSMSWKPTFFKNKMTLVMLVVSG